MAQRIVEVPICFKHQVGILPKQEDWSFAGFRFVTEHRFDVRMKETKCPTCLKELDQPTKS